MATSTDIGTAGYTVGGRRLFPTLAVVSACLAGTAVFAWLAQQEVAQRESDVFRRLLTGVTVSLGRAEETYEQVLLGVSGFVSGSQDLKDDEWDTYLRAIQRQERLPEINDVGLIEIVRPEDGPESKWQARTRLVTLSSGETLRVSGRDLVEDPGFSPAITLAVNERRTAFSRAIENRFTGGPVTGYALMAPVLPRDDQPDRIDQVVFLSFNATEFISAAQRTAGFPVCIDLFDDENMSENSFVTRYCSEGANPDADHFYQGAAKVTIGGRIITICLLAERGFYVAPLTVPMGVIIPLGLAIALLFGGLVWYESSTRDRARMIAHGMIADLEETRDRYDRVVRVSGVGFWERDHATGQLLWSDKMFELMGLPTDTDIKSRDVIHDMAHPDDKDRVFQAVARHVREGADFSEEFRLWRPCGSEIWIYATATTARDEAGTPIRTTGSVTDITQRKIEEERRRKNERELTETIAELRESQKRLDTALSDAEAASRAKSTFLSTMSHELRTPLNAILGFSEVIRDNLLKREGGAAYGDYARDIHSSGEHLLDLINDILDLAKIEEGQTTLNHETLSVPDVIEGTLNLMQPRAIAKGQSLSSSGVAAGLMVWADRRALKQVLFNLIANAIQFTGAGGKIEVTAKAVDSGGVEIAVTDSGIGIAGEDIKRIFNPFERVGSEIDPQGYGTGLGLAVVGNLIALHGGEVTVESEVGRGSTFRVVFPPGPGADLAN